MKFLVVDDDPEVRRVLGDSVRAWGHDCDLAESGAACLAACADGAPDVLVLDVAMPDMDGATVLVALRERGCEPAHVVLVTPVRAERHRELADHFGVRVLSKPFDAETLERFFAPIVG